MIDYSKFLPILKSRQLFQLFFSLQKKLKKQFSGESIGIDVNNGELIDAAEAQIYDHILIKAQRG